MDAGLGASLQSQVGGTAASALIQIIKKTKDTNDMPLIPGKGLLAHLKKPADDTTAREAELAKLKAEEEAAKKKAVPEWFAETWEAILSYGKGQPQIGGDAAKVYGAFRGYDHKAGQGYGGTGELGDHVSIHDVAQFQELLKDLVDSFGEPQVTQVAAADPDPTPTVAATLAGLLPDDAPVLDTPSESGAELAAHAEASKALAEKPAPARKPRTTKAKAGAAVTDAPTKEVSREEATTMAVQDEVPVVRDESPAADAQYVKQIESQPTPAPATSTKVNLFVDVLVEGGAFVDFAQMVDSLANAMAQRFNLVDIRTGGNDSPLGFGKWKGVLSAAIRETDIPAGTYQIDARGSEVYEEAVQALRQVVKRTGGVYLRGTR
jgi:hypothetical protein